MQEVLALAESNTEQAVLIVSRRADLLGSNRLGRALLGFGPGPLPNMARWLFRQGYPAALYEVPDAHTWTGWLNDVWTNDWAARL